MAAAKNNYHLKTAPSIVHTRLEELGQKLPLGQPNIIYQVLSCITFLHQGWIRSSEGHQKPRSHLKPFRKVGRCRAISWPKVGTVG